MGAAIIATTSDSILATRVSTVWAATAGKDHTVRLVDDLAHQWLSDEPVEAGGTNAGPSPERLLLSSLGACTAITLQMYAARKQWPLSGVRVMLEYNADGKPAAGTDIRRRIDLQGDLSDEQRERLLQIANACPIHKVLTREVRIATALELAGSSVSWPKELP